MSKKVTFLGSLQGKDIKALRVLVTERDASIRSLKFDLGFGKVDALAKLRTAKRERAQLLTLMRQLKPSDQEESHNG